MSNSKSELNKDAIVDISWQNHPYPEIQSHQRYNEQELTYCIGSQHEEIRQTVNLMRASEQYEILQSTGTAENFSDVADTVFKNQNINDSWGNDMETTLIDSEIRRTGTDCPVLTPYPLVEETVEGDAGGGNELPDEPATLPDLPQDEKEEVWKENSPESPSIFEQEINNEPIIEVDCYESIETPSNNNIEVDCFESIETPSNNSIEVDCFEPIETPPNNNIEVDCFEAIETYDDDDLNFEPIEASPEVSFEPISSFDNDIN
jgi:hypothetical protein